MVGRKSCGGLVIDPERRSIALIDVLAEKEKKRSQRENLKEKTCRDHARGSIRVTLEKKSADSIEKGKKKNRRERKPNGRCWS